MSLSYSQPRERLVRIIDDRRCPGCNHYPAGHIVQRGRNTWHLHCWAEHLEEALKEIRWRTWSGKIKQIAKRALGDV